MPVGEICNREVVFTPRNTPVIDAAKLMRRRHVGTLVVVDQADGRPAPAGIVTDRDLAIGVLAAEVDPSTLSVGDVMGGELITAGETMGIFEVIQLMRYKGVRRIPVVDGKGGLVGIVASDDLLRILGEEITELAKVISREQQRERRIRR